MSHSPPSAPQQISPFKFLWNSLLGLSLIFALSACLEGEFTLHAFNASSGPISIAVGEEVLGTVPPGKGRDIKLSRAEGTQIMIKQAQTTLETLTVGQNPLVLSEDNGALYIVGGPTSMALGNFTDFYGEAKAKPEIKDVVNLRNTKFHQISKDMMLSYPSPVFPRELIEGKQMIRMVPIPPKVTDDKIKDYMYYELKHLK